MAESGAPNHYTKMKGHSTTAGEFFEIKMVALLFLRALNKEGLIFEMGSNVDGAGALDDVVLRFKRKTDDAWTVLFVQLKHKLKEELTNEKLCSKNKDFGICKYFQSFLKIKFTPDPLKRWFEGKVGNIHCAIFTNAKKWTRQMGPNTAYQEALDFIKQEYDCVEEETKLEDNTSSCEGDAKGVTNIDNDTICAKIDAALANSLEMCRNLLGSDKGEVYQFGDVEKQRTKTKKKPVQNVRVVPPPDNTSGLCEDDLGDYMNDVLFKVIEKQSAKEVSTAEQIEDNKNRMDLDLSTRTVTDECPSQEQHLYRLKIQFHENHGDKLADDKESSEILFKAVSVDSNSRLSYSKFLQVFENGCFFCDIKALPDSVFQESFLAEWKNGTEKTIVVACNEPNKEKHGLSDSMLIIEMEAYLTNLLVFHSQPSVEQLDAVIKKELKIRLKKEQKYGVNFDSVFADYMIRMEHLCEGTTVLDNKNEAVLEAWHKTVADNCSSGEELLYRLKIQFEEDQLMKDKLIDFKEISAVLCLALSSESSSRLSVTKLLQVLEDGYLFFGIKALSDSVFQESILAEWKNGSRKTIVVVCNETEMAANAENIKTIKKLKDQIAPKKNRTIIVLTSKHNAAYLCRNGLGKDAPCLEDKFEYSSMTTESKDMIFDAKFYLQNHETRVKNLLGGDLANTSKYLTASAVVEILEGVQSHCAVAFPSQEIYIDRWLERAEIVKASILCEKSLSAWLLVLDSSLDTVQSIISQADTSLTVQEIQETLQKFYPYDETPLESETFTLGLFKCKFGLNASGKYLFLRTPSDKQPDYRWFIFVFEGFDQDNMTSLLADSSRQSLRLVEGTIKWVESKSDQALLADSSCSSQHILQLEGGKMKWVESRFAEAVLKTFSIIREHLDDVIVQSLAPKSVADIDDRLVVICAEPGMGKSTLIGHLLNKMKHIYPGYWVIAIPLNYNTHLLANNKLNGDAHAFLAAAAGIKSEFQLEVLKVALQETGTVAVILDGFDEVSPTYSQVCCNLLTKLCETKVWKIWVTTRYSTRNALEDHTGTLSRKLRPFDDKDKRKFFELFLDHKEIDEEKKKEFLDLILDKKNTVFTDREQEIMGIPLQTRMMAEVFVDMLADGKDISEILKEMDLLYLVEKFVEKKRDIFVGEKMKVLTSDASNRPAVLEVEYDSQHKHFAVHEIFSEEDISAFVVVSNFKAETSLLYASIKSGDDKTGIIDGIVNGKPKFIHQVFAEYFVARFIAENIGTGTGTWNTGKKLELLKKNLYTANFFVVREILDKILAKRNKLHIAVLNEDVSEVQRLVQGGVDVRDGAGRTAMHLAAALGTSNRDINEKRGSILNYVVENCTDVNLVNLADSLLEYTPLQYAHITRSWWAVDRLLLCENITIPDALPDMCKDVGKMKDSELIQGVVSHDLDRLLEFCLKYPEGEKAFSDKLREAIEYKSWKVATSLAKIVSISEAQEVFYIALNDRYADLAVALISRGVEIKSPSAKLDDATPLMLAAQSGQKQVVAALLVKVSESKRYDFVNLADMNIIYTPMYWAAKSGYVDIVKLLFDAGSNISFENRDTALMTAAENGHLEVVEFLLEKVTDPVCKRSYLNRRSKDDRTVFELAMSDEVKDKLQKARDDLKGLLTDSRANQPRPTNRDVASAANMVAPTLQSLAANDRTPLHIAVLANNRTAARKEIKAKNATELPAFLNTSDSHGNTALHLAASSGLVEMTALLVEAGGDLELVNKSIQTPLMLAVESGKVELVQWLCQKEKAKGVVNHQDDDGNTALHLAATKGDYEILESLILAGADWQLQNVNGETPLICATIGGSLGVVQRIVFCTEEDDLAGRRRGGRSAYIRVKDLARKNAIDHAVENDHNDVREFLEDEGPFLVDMEGVEYG